MDKLRKLLGFLLMIVITSTAKTSPSPASINEVAGRNIVGTATNIISNALLQGQLDSTTNYVFSPIGYATILSILSEGSKGQTQKEILEVLQQSENLEEVRTAYKNVLIQMQGDDPLIAPQFKTWFYIYRNNTAESDFRKILTNYYQVDVKDIDRYDYVFDTARTAEQQSDSYSPTNSKDILQFDDLKKTEPKDQSGAIDGFETLKTLDIDSVEAVEAAEADYDQLNKDEKKKVSKFDRDVDDKQYVEVPLIAEQIKKEKLEAEKLKLKVPLTKEEGPEKITLSLKKDEEMMEATESRHFKRFGRAQPLYLEGDVTSALSGNSIVGKNEDGGSELESKMLLFNGLYFRGNWATPFFTLRSDELSYFNTLSEKQTVKFMRSRGTFKYSEMSALNVDVVELPYENDRYALMLVLPKTNEGLKEFIKQLNDNSMNDIITSLEPTAIELSLPKFRLESTSRAEKALGKLGLTTLFTSKADLSGLAPNAKYQIEELVQHVAVRVDEGSSSQNALSAGNVMSRGNLKMETMTFDRPFIFYVRDVIDNVVLAAGKIMEIPVQEEIASFLTVTLMSIFDFVLGISVFIVTTVLIAQGQGKENIKVTFVCIFIIPFTQLTHMTSDQVLNGNFFFVETRGLTPSEEAELKRVNSYQSPNFKPNNQYSDNISFNNNDRVKESQRPEPLPLQLRPKQKFANSKPVTYFAWELFRLANNPNVANYVLSPLSPQLLLSHLVTVAAGQTKNEITRAIRYNDPNQLGYLVDSMLQTTSGRELSIASAFFVNKDMKLNNMFVDDSVARNVDVVIAQFSDPQTSKALVNKWVSEKTKQKITNLQLSINADTRLLMTSVVYFAAKWLYTFKPAGNELFYNTNSHKSVKMMSIKKKFNYGHINRLAEWVAIPYDSAESMVIIMPEEHISLDKMILNMSEDVFLNITENVNKDETQANVDLLMPTFTISSLVSLVEPFRKMGMNSLFTPDADIPNLARDERVQLSNAQQQSILEVNELGTVAVSITTFTVVALSYSPPIPSVKLTVNRPFLCVIVDRDTNIPLFVAKVSNPQ
ncbi:unnamed protein product [Diamesa serratosioi]